MDLGEIRGEGVDWMNYHRIGSSGRILWIP